MTTPSPDDLGYAPVRLRYEVDEVEQRGDVTSIRRARERASGRHVGIERALPAFRDESESWSAFVALEDSRSQLRHPHVLEYFDVARDDESPYRVVEWPAGGSLAERMIKRGPLGELELLKVAKSVASALEHAAARRIHHGGIVPENLCLTADGSVKVAGFGFDRLRASSRTGRPTRMDPSASDVHDLCRTLYRLATAAERYEAERVSRLPAWLREVLTRGLVDDPARRFRDAAEFLESLERLRQVAFGGGPRSDSYEPTIEVSPAGGSNPKEDSAGARGSSSASKGSGSKGSGSRGGSTGRRGSPDEFPWRPLDEQYELEGAPKQGGMGAVFQARELATGRFVAVKRMKPGVSIDQDAWRRFHREASSIANLNHPHVLHLMQAGRDEYGDYIVLEWASGGSLLERIQAKGKLEVDEVLALGRKIGSALVYAHGKGCIHRDIKPHNILISDSGEPKLADFGLARTLGDETLTTAGGGAGSLHYMAPEQSEDARHADERSDLYSFAKTLYHAATGKKPIAIDSAALPPPLRKPLLKAISDRREDRHASIAEFLEDLERNAATSGGGARRLVATIVLLATLGAGAYYYPRWNRGETRDETPRVEVASVESPVKDPDPTPPSTAIEIAKDDPARKSDPPAKDREIATPDPVTQAGADAPKGEDPAKPNSPPETTIETPAPDPAITPQETAEDPAADSPPTTSTEAPPPAQPDPALVARYQEMIEAANAWNGAWTDITTDNGDGARPLVENDERRAGLAALEDAKSRVESDLRAAVERAESAVHALRSGYSLATVAWLRSSLDAALEPEHPDFDADRVEVLLGELRGYVPEFCATTELQRYSAAVLARARETANRPAPDPATDHEAPPTTDPGAATDAPPLDPDDPWSLAIDAIRNQPIYRGLVLAKDPALRPLGPDPASGLFEFLLEGSGDAPFYSNDLAVVAASTGIVLVLVPGGPCVMGSSANRGSAANHDPESQRNEQPEHTVELDPFLIGKYELTAAQWTRLGGSGAAEATTPASGMTWAQAQSVLDSHGLALPTEAQWEHACRGGTATPWPTGSDVESTRTHGHLRFVPPIAGRPLDQPLPVGSLGANGFGLHDVLGNVAEYCRDTWTGDHGRASRRAGDGLDTASAGVFRVFRGGCYKDHPKRSRSAARDFCPADNVGMKTSVIGIRVARSIVRP